MDRPLEYTNGLGGVTNAPATDVASFQFSDQHQGISIGSGRSLFPVPLTQNLLVLFLHAVSFRPPSPNFVWKSAWFQP
jgi:hypothetical protein